MRFAFTDDQLAMQDAVRDLLSRECPAEVVRVAWPAPDTDGQGPGAGARSSPDQRAALWQHLADMGVFGLLVPEDRGGLGLDELAATLVLEESGYAAVPHPVVETVCVTSPLLAAAGEAKRLEAVIGGERLGVVEPFSDRVLWATGANEALVVRLSQDSGSTSAEWSATLIGLGATQRPSDSSILLGWPDAAVPAQIPPAHVATERVTRAVTVDGALDAVDLRGWFHTEGTFPAAAVALAFDRAALGTAAQLIGLSRRMLDLTVAYVKERKQFGVPIGSFQAVKHHLADARLQIEFAAPAVYRAAWSLASNSPTAARDVSMAKAMASDCAHLVGRKSLQCHGGIGYTVEYDLHLFLKRAWALERSWGDAAWHRDRVGRAIGV